MHMLKSETTEAIITWEIKVSTDRTHLTVRLGIKQMAGSGDSQLSRYRVCPTNFVQIVDKLIGRGLQMVTVRQLCSDLTRLAERSRIDGFPRISRCRNSLWDWIGEISSGSPI